MTQIDATRGQPEPTRVQIKPVTNGETVRTFLTTFVAQAKAALDAAEIKKPGFLQMSRLHPMDDDDFVPNRYALDDVEEMIADAVTHSEAGHNVYIEGRTVSGSVVGKKRGKLEDTVAVFSFAIDSDADKGMGWIPATTEQKPSMKVATSPGNFHGWIFLGKAVTAKMGKELGERIRKAVHGDHNTGTVTQPYRVAGTVNYPNKKKIARGRVPVATAIVDFDPERLFTPEEIEKAFPASTGEGGNGGGGDGGAQPDEATIPADTIRVIRNGPSASASARDRSQTFWNVMVALKRLDFTVEGIVNLLERYPDGIAKKYEGRLRQEIERSYGKIKPSEPPPGGGGGGGGGMPPPDGGGGGQGGPKELPDYNKDYKSEILAELNRDNAVVLDGARTRVLRFEEIVHEAGGERYVYSLPTFLPFQDFRDFYLNNYIIVGYKPEDGETGDAAWELALKRGKGPQAVSIGTWWLANPARKQYRGVVFIPAGEPVIDGRLNLWTGWGVNPKRGEWERMREHMFEVLAARDDDVDLYNLKWLAWAVQHPAQQAEVALVFLGGLGTGRGTLGKAMCRIFGQHARHVSSPDHLTGKFNAHLRQCCFLFGDECYAPTDKKAVGTLKRLVTEPTLQIEPKGRDAVEVPNCLHVMLASNNEWVIPAGAHERRYAVQEVAETHRQDAKWFGPLYEELRSGGLEAMLFDLLNYDLGDWHPRQIVRTAALAKQQVETLSALDQWWLELLQTGVLEGASEDAPDRAISNHYDEEITERDTYGERKRTVKREALYDQARHISPRLKGTSDTALGLYLGDAEGVARCTNAWVRRRRGWKFPPLKECRERWKERFPETIWRDDKTTEWTHAGE